MKVIVYDAPKNADRGHHHGADAAHGENDSSVTPHYKVVRRKGGCFGYILSFIGGIFFTFLLLLGAVFFGGNYAIKSFIGDNGSMYALGVNGWSDLWSLYRALTSTVDETKIISDPLNKPDDAAAQAVVGQLKDIGFPVKEDGTLDYGKLINGGVSGIGGLSGAVISLSGPALGGLLTTALTEGGATYGMPSGVSVGQAGIECDKSSPTSKAVLTLTFKIDKSVFDANTGLPVNSLIKGQYVYVTCENVLSGGGALTNRAVPGSLRANDYSKKVNDIIVNLFVSLIGGNLGINSDSEGAADALTAKFGGLVCDAVRNMGANAVEFTKKRPAFSDEIRIAIPAASPAAS